MLPFRGFKDRCLRGYLTLNTDSRISQETKIILKKEQSKMYAKPLESDLNIFFSIEIKYK